MTKTRVEDSHAVKMQEKSDNLTDNKQPRLFVYNEMMLRLISIRIFAEGVMFFGPRQWQEFSENMRKSNTEQRGALMKRTIASIIARLRKGWEKGVG